MGGMPGPTHELLVLVVCMCNIHVDTLVSLRYRLYSTVCMGPNACVDELPPCVYYGYRRYTATAV